MENIALWRKCIAYPLMWFVMGFWYGLMGGLWLILWVPNKLIQRYHPLPCVRTLGSR
jgi:hypothetical protein